MLIAQITDTHLRQVGDPGFGGRVDMKLRIEAVVDYLNCLETQPDFVLATGDLVDCGTKSEYERLLVLLRALRAPLLPILGNHDLRQPFRETFSGLLGNLLPPSDFVQYVVDSGPLRLVGIDTLVEGETGGRLCPQRLAFVADALSTSDRPVLLFMHHPPYDYGVKGNANMRSDGAAELKNLVTDHGNVLAILCGHLHRITVKPFGPTTAMTIPGVSPTLELNINGDLPRGWIDTPPFVGLHLIRDDSSIVSHVVSVTEDTGLVPF